MPPALDPSLRSRIPLACAECRRLKLKCDKKKPCSSCVRRGCASICPQGRMVSKGSRFILANTEQLHEKIDALIGRVRQLEGALEASHFLNSKDSHPLLCEELRIIATPVDSATIDPEPVVKEEELAESMGTLTLESGGTRYFGSTGAFAHLWRDEDGPEGSVYKYEGEASRALARLPAELAHMAHAFPVRLPTSSAPHLSAWMVENCLPPFTEAWSLFESYWEHYAWHFTPFTRTSFVERILSPIYHRSPDSDDKPLGHRLGLLFMVFAIGDLMDLTHPLEPSSGLRYYLLARASLCLDPVLESPTVTAFQALYLMGVFLMMSRGTNEPEHAWVLSGINLKLALTLGLQHDANKFHLPPEEVENRRYALVAVVSFEVWQCLSVGRPPSQALVSLDWVFDTGKPNDKAQPLEAPRYWMASFIRNCSSKVLDTVVGTGVTSYSAILQLDARIREYPAYVPTSDVSPDDELGIGETMQRTFTSIIKEVSLLFLHRRCFAIALRDCPDDPLRSPFAPSVMSCLHSATSFISKVNEIHTTFPDIILRIWFIWPNVFVTTLILGSIVARSPGCSLASSALLHLETACQIWESASESVCGAKVLATVRQLKQKAFMAFAQNKAPRDPLAAPPGGIEISDEINALGGGGTRVISKTPQSSSSNSPQYLSDRRTPSDSSQSPSPRMLNEYTSAPTSQPILPPFPANTVDHSFDFEGMDFSQIPIFSENSLPNDFNDIFGGSAHPAATQGPPGVPTILEELGLGGGWQPVMDHLGL